MIWFIAGGIIFCLISYKLIKILYFITVDNTLMLTGAPGTGKTNEGVKWAVKLWKITKRHIRMHNRLQRLKYIPKRSYQEIPDIFSNIPIKIGRYKNKEFKALKQMMRDKGYSDSKIDNLKRTKFCKVLLKEHLTNQLRLPLRAVVFLTEIGKVASQYDWANINVQLHVNDFVSMYRQYTLGGYFICDDQSSDNVAVNIRRRLGTVINMLHFHKFWKVYWVKMRNITISEDIKTVEDDSAETNMRTKIGLFPLFGRRYDTYAFSDRYLTVPIHDESTYFGYKTNEILQIPPCVKFNYKGHITYADDIEPLPVRLNEKDSI